MNLIKASGVILAGGRSTRMKFNKAFAQIEGRPVINIIIDKFSQVFDETIIISNEPQLYESFGPKVYTDVYPGLGPISGIHAGLYWASYDKAFVSGCDMPFMNMDLVKDMISKLDNYDSVVPQIDSHLQPLSAVYSRKCLPVITDCLENNKLKLVRIFEEFNALVLTRSELERYGIVEELFLNVNDIQALDRATQIAGRYW